MFKRKIYKELENWKNSLKIKRKALVIKGLRQIGKTTIVNEFCKNNYDNIVYINFMNNKSIKKVFDNDYIVDDMIRDMSSILYNAKFIPYKTVIIFDELQECSNARSSLKAFMEDDRYDIICTGSLLGLRGYNTKRNKAIPTGFEKIITMKSMDFVEFLWAIGIEDSILQYIKDCFVNMKKVSDAVNDSLMKYFKEYLCVGGIPDAVKLFKETHDLNQVYEFQNEIIEQYKDDFGKHLDEDENSIINKIELTRIMAVFNSLPSQLSKENKKFKYSLVTKGAKAREFYDAIVWLEEFGLINICYNINCLELPLDGNKNEDQFKIYISDTGLFVSMLEKGTTFNILSGEMNIYKGAIFENVIADAFSKNAGKLYYYKKDNLEIDFVTKYNNKLTLIEVKSTNSKSKSLNEVIKKYNIKNNYKLIDGNIGHSNDINTIPLYMAFLINE